jgi:hypothetical protein
MNLHVENGRQQQVPPRRRARHKPENHKRGGETVPAANVAPIVRLEEGANHPPFAAASARAKKTLNQRDIRFGSYVFTNAIPRRLSFRHDGFPASACLLPKLNFNFRLRR